MPLGLLLPEQEPLALPELGHRARAPGEQAVRLVYLYPYV